MDDNILMTLEVFNQDNESRITIHVVLLAGDNNRDTVDLVRTTPESDQIVIVSIQTLCKPIENTTNTYYNIAGPA